MSTDAVTKVTACVNTAQAQNVDAIIVGTSSSNGDIKTASEAYSIPNIHCSGRETVANSHKKGMNTG